MTSLKEPLTIEAINDFLKANPELDSVDKLIPQLPKEFRYRRVFGFKSQSRQGSSPSHPRAILLAQDGSFTLAFTGTGDQTAGNEIEMMQVKYTDENRRTKKVDFQFGAYSFEKNKEHGFSGLNPKKCAVCHERQGSFRPIWDQNNFWPGFFGEHNSDDFGFRAEDKTRQTPNQKKYFEEFLKTLKENPGRYQLLFDDPSKVTMGELTATDEVFKGKTKSRAVQYKFPLADDEGDEGSNLRRLSEAFNYHNFRRVHASLSQHPDYQKMKWALLAASIDCPEIDTFLPEKKVKELSDKGITPQTIKEENIKSLKRLGLSLISRAGDEGGRINHENIKKKVDTLYDYGFADYYLDVVNPVNYLLHAMGKNAVDWYVRSEPEVGWFSDDTDNNGMVVRLFYDDVITEKTELKEYFILQNDPTGNFNFSRAFFHDANNEAQERSSKRFKELCTSLKFASQKAFEAPVHRKLNLKDHK